MENTAEPTNKNFTAHSFPLRSDFMAQLVVPNDMTTAEALRLRAFLLAITNPESEEHDEQSV